MSNNDRRYQKSEEAIMQAFYNLIMRDKDLTVSNIAREANIDRKTFYLHYNNIEELGHSFRANMFKNMGKFASKTNASELFSKEFIDDIFFVVNQNKQLFVNMSKSPIYDVFWMQGSGFSSIIYENVKNSIPKIDKEVFRLYFKGFVNSIFIIFNAWISPESRINETEAKEMCYKIAEHCLMIVEGK